MSDMNVEASIRVKMQGIDEAIQEFKKFEDNAKSNRRITATAIEKDIMSGLDLTPENRQKINRELNYFMKGVGNMVDNMWNRDEIPELFDLKKQLKSYAPGSQKYREVEREINRISKDIEKSVDSQMKLESYGLDELVNKGVIDQFTKNKIVAASRAGMVDPSMANLMNGIGGEGNPTWWSQHKTGVAQWGASAVATGLIAAGNVYHQSQMAFGFSPIEQFNKTIDYEMNKLNITLSTVGSIIGGAIGAFGGQLTAFMGAGLGRAIGNTVAGIFNIDDEQKKRVINQQDQIVRAASQYFDTVSNAEFYAKTKLNGDPLSDYDPNSGYTREQWISLKEQFGAIGGKNFNSWINYAGSKGLHNNPMSIMMLAGLQKYGTGFGTGMLDDLQKQFGLSNAQLPELSQAIYTLGIQGANRGLDGTDLGGQLGLLSTLGEKYAPSILGGQVVQGMNSMFESGRTNPALFSLFAQAFGLGTDKISYTDFMKRLQRGFTSENMKDLSPLLRNASGGNADMLYNILDNFNPGMSIEAKEKISSAIINGDFEKGIVPENLNKLLNREAAVSVQDKNASLMRDEDYKLGSKYADQLRSIDLDTKRDITEIFSAMSSIVNYFKLMRDAYDDMNRKLADIIPGGGVTIEHSPITGTNIFVVTDDKTGAKKAMAEAPSFSPMKTRN